MHYGRKNQGKIGVRTIAFLPQTDSILLYETRTALQNFIKIE